MKTPKLKPNLILLGLLMPTTSSYAFSLSQAWEAARHHSADYIAAEFNRDAELEQEKQAQAALYPQIAANATYQRQPPSISSTKSTRGWNVQLTQTLYDKGKMAQYRQSKINSEAAEAQLGYNHDEMMLKVSESYFNVLLAKDTIKAIGAEREAYRQQVERAKEMFERGAATAVDIHEAQAGYDNALAKEVDAITQKQLAENQLADYTGYDPSQILPVNTDKLIERIQPQVKRHSLPEWQQLALSNNSEYQVSRLNADSAAEGVKVAKANRYPKVTASVGYQHNHYTSAYQNNDYNYTGKGLSANVQVTVPLFTGGEISSRIREAAARMGEAEARLLTAERKVKLAVKQAYTENNAAQYQIRAQERVLSSNQLKLKSTRTGQEFGIRSNLEVIQAQQEVAEAEQRLAQARYRYLQSFLSLAKESGLDVQQEWMRAEMVTLTPEKVQAVQNAKRVVVQKQARASNPQAIKKKVVRARKTQNYRKAI